MASFGLPLEFTQWIELTAPREGGGGYSLGASWSIVEVCRHISDIAVNLRQLCGYSLQDAVNVALVSGHVADWTTARKTSTFNMCLLTERLVSSCMNKRWNINAAYSLLEWMFLKFSYYQNIQDHISSFAVNHLIKLTDIQLTIGNWAFSSGELKTKGVFSSTHYSRHWC